MGNYKMLLGNGEGRYKKVIPNVSITFLTSRSKVLRLSFLLKFPQQHNTLRSWGTFGNISFERTKKFLLC